VHVWLINLNGKWDRVFICDLKNAGVGLKAKAGVVAQMGSIDTQGAAEIVAHEKNGPAAMIFWIDPAACCPAAKVPDLRGRL
jgi:hypothetical protein